MQQYSSDCDQVIVAAGGSTSHVCASVPDYIRTSCVRLRGKILVLDLQQNSGKTAENILKLILL